MPDLVVTGNPVEDPAVSFAIHRVVQEGLTNALRYSRKPRRAEVSIDYGPDGIDVVVENDSALKNAPSIGAGQGLLGLRERLTLLDGRIETRAGWRGRLASTSMDTADKRDPGGQSLMTGHPIRILIVDDQELVRMGLRLMLDAEEDFEVVGKATTGDEAISQVEVLCPDIVLMDVRMPGVDGITATRRIVDTRPDARIIILTTFDLDEYAFGALRSGASGFLLKDAGPHQLGEAVRAVHAGDASISPRVTRRMLELFADKMVRFRPHRRRPHAERDRNSRDYRRGPQQRRTCRTLLPVRIDGENTRWPSSDEAATA